MSCSRFPCSGDLRDVAQTLGFYRIGAAAAGPVSDEAALSYRQWIGGGLHGSMAYMERYGDLRDDPRLLLPGARTIIVVAMSYYHQERQEGLRIASYAHGDDYHIILRDRLQRLAEAIKTRYGGETRVAVDTAPLRERYWAVKAGIGFIGCNSQLIVPGAGSYFFLGSVLTTVEFVADSPCTDSCMQCGRCVEACPGQAIIAGGKCIDARRCLSYLTIEHRGDLPENVVLGNRLYGCDECQRVCPHNSSPPVTPVAEFHLRDGLRNLTAESVLSMTQERFSRVFSRSAVKRAKLAGLVRNARLILAQRQNRDG